MSKYFKQEPIPEFLLSEYLKKDTKEFEGCIFDEISRQRRTKYIMQILGDVSLDEDTYKLFIKQFQSFGGRYDVRTKKETIKGIYDIIKRYKSLTSTAIDEIWFIYIKDLYEEYALADMLQKYIDIHGQTDDALESFISLVERKAKEYDEKFAQEAKSLESYKDEYPEDFIKHLQYIIKSQHIQAEQIIKYLPSKELLTKDKQQLLDISRQTRIYMDVCHPISYQMVESLATEEGLDYYPEQPSYLINGQTKVATTFTKTDFLESIKQRKTTLKQLKKV